MKGDISADFHAAAKRFSGVRAQAGRVLTDADFNAAFDVIDDTLETLVRNLLCAAGSPDSGLRVMSAHPVTLAAPDGSPHSTYEVTAAPGTFVLGGRATLLNSAIASLDQNDWMSQILTPAVLPPAPQPGRTDLVWLEQTDGSVYAVEDREIQERALGSADTTSRLRPELRLRVLDDVPPECHLAAQTLTQTLRIGGHGVSDDQTEIFPAARLGLAFVADGPSLDPCAPAGAAGYLGAENHTLQVMLTAPDRFVWAFDHGRPLYRVQIDAANGEVEFLTEPRDPMLYPLPDQVIEILPWNLLLPNREKAAARLGHLARFTGHYDPRSRRIAYDGSMPVAWQTWLDGLPAALLGQDDEPPRYFYARVWQAPVAGPGPDQQTGANIVLPETGIALHFTGNGIAGDYWTASLRPDAPETIQPWNLLIDPLAGEVPVAPPIGPRRFHAPLALVTWPTPLGPAPEIEDCRNRFHSLCRIKSCCTYQVGDGDSSFGDFNSIQDAVDALPTDGGEICLLPGTHGGAIDLRDRHDIEISGCGTRTRVEIAANPAHPNRPGIWLDRAQGIRFCDFEVVGAGGPVFGASELAIDISLTRLTILARQTAAVALPISGRIAISDCRITAEAYPAALVETDLAGLMPLVFLAGEDLRIERNRIEAESGRRNRVALGGIQIGGDSIEVRIEDNRIEGGNGHGITLGSLIQGQSVPGRDRILYTPPWITIGEDGCLRLEPGGTVTVPGIPRETAPRSAGPVTGLRIRDNLITNHGGCGISVAHWFIATAKDRLEDLDDIEIDEAEIDDNKIYRCMRLDLAAALSVDAAFGSGYGGIALAATRDLVIDDNEIRGCGSAGRSPICGIYIRFAERLRITGNRISDNGRPTSLTSPLLVGNIGGIVISQADGVEEDEVEKVREVPAVVISRNHVVSPEGRALELLGTGAMMVQGNSLTSHGNNVGGVILMLLFALLQGRGEIGGTVTSSEVEGQFRAALAQIGGSAVLILNTGVNPNLGLIASATSAFGGKGKKIAEEVPAGIPGGAAPAAAAGGDMAALSPTKSEWRAANYGSGKGVIDPGKFRNRPRGPVSFSDNIVTFDALSEAITLSLSSIAIISLDDVGMHDNHSAIDLAADMVLIDALVLGLASCRVTGNRFRETLTVLGRGRQLQLPPTFFSAVTFGILNATELNQGSYCFLTLGTKKPRILTRVSENSVSAVLDTNRHMLPDRFCETFLKMSVNSGTD